MARNDAVAGGEPESLDARMMGFQREGVAFGLAHGGRVLIGACLGAQAGTARARLRNHKKTDCVIAGLGLVTGL
jgi:hypothetical protein